MSDTGLLSISSGVTVTPNSDIDHPTRPGKVKNGEAIQSNIQPAYSLPKPAHASGRYHSNQTQSLRHQPSPAVSLNQALTNRPYYSVIGTTHPVRSDTTNSRHHQTDDLSLPTPDKPALTLPAYILCTISALLNQAGSRSRLSGFMTCQT